MSRPGASLPLVERRPLVCAFEPSIFNSYIFLTMALVTERVSGLRSTPTLLIVVQRRLMAVSVMPLFDKLG